MHHNTMNRKLHNNNSLSPRYENKKVCTCPSTEEIKKNKNMRVFIAYFLFFNSGRKMATGFTNITGITSRTSKLIKHHGI